LDFQYPRHVRFVCEKCAKCCGDTKERVRLILLLKIEAERISQRTAKGIGEFAEKIKGFEPYLFRMKKTDEGKCVFLKDNLCTIYERRPLICRFYPFQLKNVGNDKHVFTYTRECPSIGKGPWLQRSFFEKLFRQSAIVMAEDARSK
jgi:Fe-S-cluster containining protein